jgi:hypothetical protein
MQLRSSSPPLWLFLLRLLLRTRFFHLQRAPLQVSRIACPASVQKTSECGLVSAHERIDWGSHTAAARIRAICLALVVFRSFTSSFENLLLHASPALESSTHGPTCRGSLVYASRTRACSSTTCPSRNTAGGGGWSGAGRA